MASKWVKYQMTSNSIRGAGRIARFSMATGWGWGTGLPDLGWKIPGYLKAEPRMDRDLSAVQKCHLR